MGRAGGGLLSIGDQILYRLPSFIELQPTPWMVRRMYRVDVYLRVRRAVMSGWDEHAGSSPDVWPAPGHRAQDAGVLRASGVPETDPAPASQAGALHRRHRPDPEGRSKASQEPELTQVPAWLAEQIKFARDWWHDDPVCLLPGEEGGHTVFVIEFYDGCKYFGYTRKSVFARLASLMSESGGWGSNTFVREHGGSVPYVVRCVASNLDQRQGRQLRDLLVARAPGDVYVADGDPVQWVIGRNLHRRHLTALRRASCVSAALAWAKQGHQQVMHTERDDSGQFSPIPVMFTGIGEPVSTSLIQPDSRQAEQESIFTQDERAALSDVSVSTQAMSDNYEKAGLGPEVRSGELSGAEAKRRMRDPDAPKPPALQAPPTPKGWAEYSPARRSRHRRS